VTILFGVLVEQAKELTADEYNTILIKRQLSLFYIGNRELMRENCNAIHRYFSSMQDAKRTNQTFPFRAAICCVGYMYEKLGRMMGRSYEETVQILCKALKSAESQTRMEIMLTFEKVFRTNEMTYKNSIEKKMVPCNTVTGHKQIINFHTMRRFVREWGVQSVAFTKKCTKRPVCV